LDERRVKFLPEYIDSGSSATSKHKAGHHPIDVKEVWFAGSHSDMYVDPPNLNYSDDYFYCFQRWWPQGKYLPESVISASAVDGE
jgi:hypothetical protein